MKNSKLSKPIAMLTVALSLLTWFLWSRVRPQTPAMLLDSLESALRNRDSKALADAISETELREFQIDRATAEKYIRTRFLPLMESRSNYKKFTRTKESGLSAIEVPPRNGSLDPHGFGIAVGDGQNGPEGRFVMQNFLFAESRALHWDPKVSMQENKFLTMRNQAIKDGPALSSLGIKGMYSHASRRLETWEERAQAAQTRLQQLASEK